MTMHKTIQIEEDGFEMKSMKVGDAKVKLSKLDITKRLSFSRFKNLNNLIDWLNRLNKIFSLKAHLSNNIHHGTQETSNQSNSQL